MAEGSLMRVPLAVALVSLLCCASSAHADGPYEPNESPLEALAPFMGGQIAAGFETPQDVDWYRLYAFQHRQIGVLATLTSPCSSSSGSVRVELLDGDAVGYGKSLASVRVGFTGTGEPVTSARTSFTSLAGHRYFLHATQSLCPGATYTLDVAPEANLTRTLVDTQECKAARASASHDRQRWFGLRRAAARRHSSIAVKAKAQLQRQQAKVSSDAASVACKRPELTGYPFNG